MKAFGIFFATLIAIVVCATAAQAKDWAVDYTQSHIGFTGTQGSDVFVGGFKKFQISINFDPAQPQTGKIIATIDVASVFAGSSERDDALPQADWFDTGRFPQAQFVSTSIQPDSCDVKSLPKGVVIGCYKANGALTIKGVAQPVTLPFYLTEEGDYVRARATVPLLRKEFGVGQGQWAEVSFVKNEVGVMLDIMAR